MGIPVASDASARSVPQSWYAVALSEELRDGNVVTRHFCGDEVVLFRTRDRTPVVMDAYCPHLGAHLGHGGRIEDDKMICPFHGFCFDAKGACTATGYGSRPSQALRTKVWPTTEQHGVIFAFHGTAAEASWQLPSIDEAGWSPFRFHEWTLTSNPIDIAENSVDIGHFTFVHGYSNIEVTSEIETDGPMLSISYSITRTAPFTGDTIEIRFSIQQCGLGLAIVDAYTVDYDMRSRHLVMACPIDHEQINLRIGLSLHKALRPGDIHPALRLLPTGLAFPLICRIYMKHFRDDVTEDFSLWENKRYVASPVLAKGDGPITGYRKWTEQFEPTTALSVT